MEYRRPNGKGLFIAGWLLLACAVVALLAAVLNMEAASLDADIAAVEETSAMLDAMEAGEPYVPPAESYDLPQRAPWTVPFLFLLSAAFFNFAVLCFVVGVVVRALWFVDGAEAKEADA